MPKKKAYSQGVDIDNPNTSLADLGGLLKVTHTKPSFKHRDKEVENFVGQNFQANEKWFNVSKHIINQKVINAFSDRVRNFHHAIERFTFPFDNPNEKGKHLFVLTAHFDRVNVEWESLKDDYNKMVQKLINDWTDHVNEAKAELGGRFEQSLYPDPNDFADRPLTQKELDNSVAYHNQWKLFEGEDGRTWKQGIFHLRADWSQAPNIAEDLDNSVFDERHNQDDHYSTWKKPTQSQLMSKIVSSQKRKISDFKSNYARNQMDGLSQVMENTIAKCNAYNPKDKKSAPFRDTLLPILKDQLDVFGDVLESNLLSDCPKLSKSIEQAQKIINGVTVQDLRDDDSKRKDVADKLSEVHDDITDNEIDNFNELMG